MHRELAHVFWRQSPMLQPKLHTLVTLRYTNILADRHQRPSGHSRTHKSKSRTKQGTDGIQSKFSPDLQAEVDECHNQIDLDQNPDQVEMVTMLPTALCSLSFIFSLPIQRVTNLALVKYLLESVHTQFRYKMKEWYPVPRPKPSLMFTFQ